MCVANSRVAQEICWGTCELHAHMRRHEAWSSYTWEVHSNRVSLLASSAGTNVKDLNIRSLSIFSTNVLSYQTFVTVVNIVKM